MGPHKKRLRKSGAFFIGFMRRYYIMYVATSPAIDMVMV